MTIKAMQWQVYAWLDEEGTPFYISKCRVGSPAPYQPRAHGGLQPPPRNRVVTLFKSTDEEEVLKKLDYLHYELGLEEAAPGLGTLKNSIRHAPNALRETGHSQTTPVTVYKVNGEKVGDFRSCGEACYTLNLKKGSVSKVLHEQFYSHRGYVIQYLNEPFRKRKSGKRYWKAESCCGYDPDGKLHHFDDVPSAAVAVTNNRQNISHLWGSIKSPTENKKRHHGWVFFAGNEAPPFEEVTFRKRGRPAKN